MGKCGGKNGKEDGVLRQQLAKVPALVNESTAHVAEVAVGSAHLPCSGLSCSESGALEGKKLDCLSCQVEMAFGDRLNSLSSSSRQIDIGDAVAILHEVRRNNATLD